jgi:hypothetical protein
VGDQVQDLGNFGFEFAGFGGCAHTVLALALIEFNATG